jgi:ectoine hydroxylase-related dioxygenase (phytanoyl-CoA dioxygenase family)
VPWHQDAAYLEPIASRTLQLTAWVPLIDANRHNGTIQVVRGGHRSGLIASHQACAGNT